MRTETFTFAANNKGLVQREVLAASLLSVGRTVLLGRETLPAEGGTVELLTLEAGPREAEGQIAQAMNLKAFGSKSGGH